MSKGKKQAIVLLLTALFSLFTATAMAAGTLTLPASMKEIKEEAFEGNMSLGEVVLPEGIETIGSRAFADSSVASINLPSSITYIADDAFDGCEGFDVTAEQGSYAYDWAVSVGLAKATTPASSFTYEIANDEVAITGFIGEETELVVPAKIEGYPVTSLADYSLVANSQITSIELPDTIVYIGKYALDSCSGIETFEVPCGVVSIGFAAFHDCVNLTDISVDEENNAFTSEGGVLFTLDMEELVCYPAGRSAAAYEIPDSVKTIRKMAFRSSFALTSVQIPASVISIEVYAFDNCANLKDIQIDQNNAAYYAADGVVFDKRDQELVCYPNGKQGTSYQIPDGMKSIAPSAFAYCDQLKEINIPIGVTFIGDGAFEGCASLEGISIPEGVTSIEDATFLDCSSLKYVEIPETITKLGLVLFSGCDSLMSIEIPASVTSIDEYAFSGCIATIYVVEGSYTHIFCEEYGINYKVIGSEDSEGVTDDGFIYEIVNEEVTINSYSGQEIDVVVPSMIEGYPVTEISDSAFEGNTSITRVEMQAGIQRIGYRTFAECTSLITVVVPEGVTSIENEAFSACSSLSEIQIPASVKSIGDYAFSYCQQLTDLVLPDGLESIGSAAFRYCTRLDMTIPDSVKTLNMGAFIGCSSLKQAYFPDGLTEIQDKLYYECTALTHVEIPESVTKIGDGAFSGCTGLTEIDIPTSVTTLGESVFEDCTNLTAAMIPDSVTEMGSGVFGNCSSVVSAKLSANCSIVPAHTFRNAKFTEITIPDGVTQIEGFAFNGCTALRSIVIPRSVVSISEYTFSSYAFTVYGYEDSYAETYAVEHEWPFIALNDEDLPSEPEIEETPVSSFTYTIENDGVTITGFIGDEIEVAIPEKIEGYPVTSIGEEAFSDCTNIVRIRVPEFVTSIGQGAFNWCTSLISINIPESVTSIDTGAFWSCSKLTSITIPESVTSIGTSVFGGCTSLSTVNIPNSVTSIGESAFYDCWALTTIDIPNSVTSIEPDAFKGCKNLRTFKIPAGVTSIHFDVFTGCNGLESISVDAENTAYTSQDGVLFTADMKELILYPCGKDATVYDIPNTVTNIAESAFAYCYDLTDVNIPDSVTSIGEYAFYCCDGLISIEIPEAVTRINSGTFEECWGLTSIAIPNSVTSIGDYAFCFCESLDNVIIPDSVTSIEQLAFYSCDLLSSITLSNSLTSIGDMAFAYSDNLVGITLPDSVTHIGEKAFYECTSLVEINYPLNWTTAGNGGRIFEETLIKTMDIPEGVTTIPEYAFMDCTNFSEINLPDTVTTIGDYVFKGCTGLIDIELSKELEVIGYKAFEGCTSLTSVKIPDTVSTIDSYAFKDCGSLTEINYPMNWTIAGAYGQIFEGTLVRELGIPEGVTAIPGGAFYGCTNFREINLPDSLSVIGSGAFRGCTGLTQMDIPKDISVLSSYVFSNCTGLVSITLPDGLGCIEYGAFMECENLTNLYIPDSVDEIEGRAFYNCKNLANLNYPIGWSYHGGYYYDNIFTGTALKTLIIPEGVTEIPAYAFQNCSNFTYFVLPDSLQSIPAYAFAGCTNLEKIWIPEGIELQHDEEGNQTSFIPIASTAFNDVSTSTMTIYGVSGSYAETFAAEKGYPFVAGEMSIPEATHPILTDFTLNATPLEITVQMGSQLVFGGTINAGSAPLVDVQASVFLASDHEQGAVYERAEGINADTYDLSGLNPMTVGAEYNSFAMTAGNSYDVVLYVTDENGNGFESDPYIRVNVVEASDTIEWNGHTYQLIDESMTWTEAKAYCESLGGHLVTFDSADENSAITAALGEDTKNCYWIGLYRDTVDTQWKWVTGETVSYENWAENEPSNWEEQGECYVHLYGRTYTGGNGTKNTGEWNDACNNGAEYASDHYALGNFGFICEFEDDVVYPTVNAYTLNATPTELTVPVGSSLSFGGTINAGNAPLAAVQVSIFDADDLTKGVEFARVESLSAETFDLSSFTDIIVGQTYSDDNQTLTMEAGKSYIVMLYAADENGNGFEDVDPETEGHQGPSIKVNVTEEPEAYAVVSDFAINGIAADVIVHEGQTFELSGIVAGSVDAQIKALQVSVFNTSNGDGEVYFHSGEILAEQIDLSSIPTMTIGEAFGDSGFTMTAGNTYNVMLYATNEEGNGFEGRNPYILVHVKENVEPNPDYEYTLSDSTCVITAYVGSDTAVELPETIEGCTVVEIAEEAFAGNNDLVSVVISESVATIGANAFGNCANLENVVIPVGTESIASDAFDGCDALTLRFKKGCYAETYAIENEIPYLYIAGGNDTTYGFAVSHGSMNGLVSGPDGGKGIVITVISDQSWTVESGSEWITLSTDGGESGETFYPIIEENKAYEARTGYLTVRCEGFEPIVIRVEQYAAERVAGVAIDAVDPRNVTDTSAIVTGTLTWGEGESAESYQAVGVQYGPIGEEWYATVLATPDVETGKLSAVIENLTTEGKYRFRTVAQHMETQEWLISEEVTARIWAYCDHVYNESVYAHDASMQAYLDWYIEDGGELLPTEFIKDLETETTHAIRHPYIQVCSLCDRFEVVYINEESDHAFETVVETVYENVTAETHDVYSITTVLCTTGINENICGYVSSQEKVLIEAEAAHVYENGVCACGECNAVWAFEMSGTINLNVQVTSGQPDSSKRYLLIAEDSEGFHYFDYIDAGSSSASFAVVGDLGLKRAHTYSLYVLPEGVELTDENRSKYALGDLTVPLFNGKMVTRVYSGESDVEDKDIVYVGEKIKFHWDGSYGVDNTQVVAKLNGLEVFNKTYDHSGPGIVTLDSNEIGAVEGSTLEITVTVDPNEVTAAEEASVFATRAATLVPVSYTWTAQYAARPVAGYKIKMDWNGSERVDVTNQRVHVTTAGGANDYFGLRAYYVDDEGNENLIPLTEDECGYEWRLMTGNEQVVDSWQIGYIYDLTEDSDGNFLGWKSNLWGLKTKQGDGFTFYFNSALDRVAGSILLYKLSDDPNVADQEVAYAVLQVHNSEHIVTGADVGYSAGDSEYDISISLPENLLSFWNGASIKEKRLWFDLNTKKIYIDSMVPSNTVDVFMDTCREEIPGFDWRNGFVNITLGLGELVPNIFGDFLDYNIECIKAVGTVPQVLFGEENFNEKFQELVNLNNRVSGSITNGKVMTKIYNAFDDTDSKEYVDEIINYLMVESDIAKEINGTSGRSPASFSSGQSEMMEAIRNASLGNDAAEYVGMIFEAFMENLEKVRAGDLSAGDQYGKIFSTTVVYSGNDVLLGEVPINLMFNGKTYQYNLQKVFDVNTLVEWMYDGRIEMDDYAAVIRYFTESDVRLASLTEGQKSLVWAVSKWDTKLDMYKNLRPNSRILKKLEALDNFFKKYPVDTIVDCFMAGANAYSVWKTMDMYDQLLDEFEERLKDYETEWSKEVLDKLTTSLAERMYEVFSKLYTGIIPDITIEALSEGLPWFGKAANIAGGILLGLDVGNLLTNSANTVGKMPAFDKTIELYDNAKEDMYDAIDTYKTSPSVTAYNDLKLKVEMYNVLKGSCIVCMYGVYVSELESPKMMFVNWMEYWPEFNVATIEAWHGDSTRLENLEDERLEKIANLTRAMNGELEQMKSLEECLFPFE